MERRDFIQKSFYMGAATAIGSLISSSIFWKPVKLMAAPPTDSQVVRTICGSVQNWNYNVATSNIYHNFINYPVVKDMLNEAVCSLTSQTNILNAWNDILNYQAGQTVAIKINLNWPDGEGDNWQNIPNSSSQLLGAVIHSLQLANVPLSNIKVYDVSRDQVARIRTNLNSYGFSAVDYISRDNSSHSWDNNATMTFPQEGGIVRRYPNVLTSADHLINLALLKGHKSFITGALKNHYGTIEGNSSTSMSRSDIHNHKQVNVPLINTSTHIKDKTRLNIIEGFFMTYEAEYDFYQPCENINFFPAGISGYPSPNCLIVAKNPVAADSLVHDFVAQERQLRSLAPFQYDFLVNAQNMGLGTYELGSAQQTDMSYSTLQYQSRRMNLVTKSEVDTTLRKVKEGLMHQNQLSCKVERLEKNW